MARRRHSAALKISADKTTLKSADGTDDAQIIVTVVDADGKALSNSPPVTLTVESGPGEFPTGPAITFDPNSDIAIRDGQAAMEFRSYYSGKTVIRATSPGLKDATFQNYHTRRTKVYQRQNAARETAALRPLHGLIRDGSGSGGQFNFWPQQSDPCQQRVAGPLRAFR